VLTAQAARDRAGERAPAPRWARVLVALQLAAVLVLGGVTVARFHVWAPVDERQHYDYVQKVAEDHRLPLIDDLVSPEVEAITERTWPRPAVIDPRTLGLAGRSYEAFQPPLYYLLAAPVFAAVPDHRDKLTALRLFDLALVLVAIALLWRIGVRVAPRAPLLPFAAALAVVLWPGVLVRAITASNAPLELALATALLLVLWRLLEHGVRRRAIAAGALLGACVLTKSTLIYMAPLVLVVLALDWRARRDTLAVVIALALPLLMLAPWLAFNLDRYDALTASKAARDQQQPVVNPAGITYGAGAVAKRTGRLYKGVLPVEWAGQLNVTWVRAAALVLAVALFGGALALLAAALARRRPWTPLWFFGLPVVCAYAVLLAVILAANWPILSPRYIYPVLPALALAVAAGFADRARAAWWAIAGCSALTAILWVDMAGAFYFTDIGEKLGI
jgi:4-amino-4-deoxy-L-arabinose transferase-like glycosyltransferase